MTKRVLTQFAAGEIRRLRAELNEWREPRWTGMEIAAAVGVSESTVWRVLGKQAAYAKMGKADAGGLSMEAASAALANSPEVDMREAADASARRVMEMLASMPQTAEIKKLELPPLTPEAQARLATFRNPLDE